MEENYRDDRYPQGRSPYDGYVQEVEEGAGSPDRYREEEDAGGDAPDVDSMRTRKVDEFFSRGIGGKDSKVSVGLLILVAFALYALVMFAKSVLYFFR